MAGATLTANGTAATISSSRRGKQLCISADGTLGGGIIDVVFTADDGGGAKIIGSFDQIELPLAKSVEVPAGNVLTVILTGATSPNVRIDVDLIQTYSMD